VGNTESLFFTINTTLLILMLIRHTKKATCFNHGHLQPTQYYKRWKYYNCIKRVSSGL